MDQKPKTTTILDSWSSLSEKTVFILDRSQYSTHVSSGHSIDGDSLKDSKKIAHLYVNQPPTPRFDRSVWTCTIEAVIGYSRLVWDIFTPDQRSISILSALPFSDTKDKGADPIIVERICTWQDEHQNLDHLMKSLAKMSHTHQICRPQKLLSTNDISSFPNCRADSLAMNRAFDQALNELSHLTNSQIDLKLKSESSLAGQIDNNGRIVLISSFQSQEELSKLIDNFAEIMRAKNESLKEALRTVGEGSTGITFSPINYCDLVVVNTFPILDEGPCSRITSMDSFRPSLHTKVYSVRSGRIIAGLLNNLCLQHHNLKSTTITGIPMKEEQNASSSSQYDVEIVHCSSIHEEILNSGSPLLEGVVEIIDRNGYPCDTFKLSWTTPRSPNLESNHCVANSRITAVDLHSRPSACLTNFLLNGKSVTLEIFKSKGNRMVTHILTNQNGELFIHSLAIGKTITSDSPSISESLGGKVGDYRQQEFLKFMKNHTLTKTQLTDEPLMRTLSMIKRQTLYWPLSLGHTILMNIPHLAGKLLQLIPKESLTESDVVECKKAIDELVQFQTTEQALPSVTICDPSIKSAGGNNKGANRLKKLYSLLRNELEYFLKVHSTTNEHEAILEYMSETMGDTKATKAEERGMKRSSSSKMIAASPAKRARVTNHVIPEIHEDTSKYPTSVFYKTGLTLWATYTELLRFSRQGKTKLPFVGWTQLQQPLQIPQQQQQPMMHQQMVPTASGLPIIQKK